MFNKLFKGQYFLARLRNHVDYNLEPYKEVLMEINKIKLESASDDRLKEISGELRRRARNGETAEELLTDSYALVREAIRRVLGINPFEVQILAGIALHRGKLVEMATGEGKTLAAVMPAYLNALTGQGVHILTFNDYLAGRDAGWMGPVYNYLGLKVGHVREGLSIAERQAAYASDVTYVTAREAGFDYLRDSLCLEKEELVHRPFHYAIVDEADSILIDEARIPLVIAGEFPEDDEGVRLTDLVKALRLGEDYEVDPYGKSVYLTDRGLLKAEKILGHGNFYDSRNLGLLASLNCALYAETFLERDKDYLVRNGRIEIIDEFTGRIAAKRRWPDGLQKALECKEGLNPEHRGMIMGSVPLQFFLSLYSRIAGMSGTAGSAAEEFREFYGLEVLRIPNNKPCIRADQPDLIFTHLEAKQKAIVSEIKRAHETGQPILVGTASVEESEHLADELAKVGVKCQVLNAKNNEMEAKIIAGAGSPGAVTVSTNMAGRGVDIKLGGEREEERERAVSLGGLYIIGTSRQESRRLDDQLRGRAGRQGEPGASRFFVSLEDDIFRKYNIAGEIPAKHLPAHQEGPLDDPVIARELARGQRIAEGYNFQWRKQLWKYSYIIEQQRRIIYNKRLALLTDQESPQLLAFKSAERYRELRRQVGEEVLRKVEKQMTLHFLSKCWAEYLDYMDGVREGVHFVIIGRENPIDEFHRRAIEAFAIMQDRCETEIIQTFNTAEITEKGIDLIKERLVGPAATWTYLMNDSPDQFSNLPHLLKTAVNYINRPLFTVQSLYRRLSGRIKG